MSGRGRGRGSGGGKGRQFRGGRPKVRPQVDTEWITESGESKLLLTKVEIEVLRLVDHEKLTQEQASERLSISRGTLWRILQEARKKVIHAFLEGKSSINFQIIDDKEEE